MRRLIVRVRMVLVSCGEIMRPQDSSRDRSPRCPRARQTLLLVRCRKGIELLDLTQGGGQSQVPLRPDIGSSKRHEVIDIHAPWSQPWDPQESLTSLLIRACCNRSQVESTIEYSLCHPMTVASLLTCESKFPQPAHFHFDHRLRSHTTQVTDKTPIHGARRSQRNLLLEDDLNQRGKTGSATPHRGLTQSVENSAQIRIHLRQPPGPFRQ